MTNWEEIEDLELKCLPKIKIDPEPKSMGAIQHYRSLCSRLGCEPIDKEIRVYGLRDLIDVMDFFNTLKRHLNLLRFLPQKQSLTVQDIEDARAQYFIADGKVVPDQHSTEAYAKFYEENPEMHFFDYLTKNRELVEKVIREKQNPTKPEDLEALKKKIVPEWYYLRINCCAPHIEDTILHVMYRTWVPDPTSDKEKGWIAENMIIYAPDTRMGPRVHLTNGSSQEYMKEVQELHHFFRSLT